MMGMMEMWFYWSTETGHFLFKGLDIEGTKETVAACAVLFVVTIILEASRCLMLYWNVRLSQHPLTYGRTDGSRVDKSPLFSSLMIPSSLEQIKQRKVRYFLFSSLTHIFNICLGYMVMLAVMRYSIWMLTAVLLGSMVGYFIFGALEHVVHIKYTNLTVFQINEEIGHINNAHELSDAT